ncbi:protein PET117 homolog, mitochondrial [Narcine bancroftii]|uniref:protein PET117 homolog, mitochondrial n=1 Tax=Narcine bancroftii TaxID=1343680 RepID=UPI003831EBBE
MSTVSKVVLGVSAVLTAGTVAGVHLRQKQERERLREGVYRDLERQERKKENIRILEEQISLTKKLEAERLGQTTLSSGSSQRAGKQ